MAEREGHVRSQVDTMVSQPRVNRRRAIYVCALVGTGALVSYVLAQLTPQQLEVVGHKWVLVFRTLVIVAIVLEVVRRFRPRHRE